MSSDQDESPRRAKHPQKLWPELVDPGATANGCSLYPSPGRKATANDCSPGPYVATGDPTPIRDLDHLKKWTADNQKIADKLQKSLAVINGEQAFLFHFAPASATDKPPVRASYQSKTPTCTGRSRTSSNT